MAITYGIERSLDGVIFAQIDTTENDEDFIDTLLASETDYHYRVRKLSPNSDYSSIIMGTTLESTAPDPDAQLVIDSMVNPTPTQEAAINSFIVQDKLDGNWDLRDDFACISLGDVTTSNGLLKWKSLNQMTSNGGSVIDLDGWHGNGTNAYLGTGFIPSIDGVKYQQDDAFITAFIKDTGGAYTVNEVVFGTRNTVSFIEASIIRNSDIAITPRMNSNLTVGFTVGVENNQLLGVIRSSSANYSVVSNGVLSPEVARSSQASPDRELYIGALNAGVASQFFGGVISTVSFGAHIGFDYAASDLNERNLLSALGLTI